MKSFEDLTRLGKLRRLRKLATKALENYDLQITWLRFFTQETNTMFYLQTADKQKYVLRIYSDEDSTLVENQAEMYWLDAIKRDKPIKAIEPIVRRDGTYITTAEVQGIPGEKRCVLFKWVPGKTLEHYLTPKNYYKLGQTLARLHIHAETLNPLPMHIQPKKWDTIFYYPDEPVVYNAAEYSHLFPPERIACIDAVITHANRVFENLYACQDDLILIHGDLHYWNVHVYQGDLYVIDFEDVMLGHPVQDIAITLYYGKDHQAYHELCAAFQQGYTSIRVWPVENEYVIAALMAARSVNFINYVARIEANPQAFIEQRCDALKTFLQIYS
jgi:Ser/Thr protein kinase RdoA (MazF antagonist)